MIQFLVSHLFHIVFEMFLLLLFSIQLQYDFIWEKMWPVVARVAYIWSGHN